MARGTEHADRSRWRARPVLSRVLSLAVFVVPVGTAYVLTRLVAPLVSDLAVLARVLVLGVLAVAVGLVAERLLRRVLPLAALLRMTMLFPDRAPSRFKLARAAGNTRVLEERARNRPDETVGEAAVRILSLLTTLSAHDRRTRGHSERVRVFTDVLAEELHLPQDDRDRLRWSALLHDLGKVDVPAAVLNKPSALDPAEWDVVRRHPDRGAVLAGPLLAWLGDWGAAISQHHERFDGRGYPRGLAGHDIALAGRIVAVADVFEVMTAARSYKRPMSVRAARRELASVAGTQLDPVCVRAFLGASLPRVLWAVGPLALLVNLPFLRGLAQAVQVVERAGSAVAGQAATAAAAAATAAVVVAAPAAGTPSAAPPAPDPGSTSGPVATSASSGAVPGTPGSPPGRTAGSSVPTASAPPRSPGGTPSAGGPSGSSSGPAPSSSSSGGVSSSPTVDSSGSSWPSSSAASPTPTASASATPSATFTPSASSSATATPSASTSSTAPVVKKLATPTILAISIPLPILHLPVIVTFASTDAGVTFSCRVDGNPWYSCTSPTTLTGLSTGSHRIEVRSVDSTGNLSDVARRDFTV